MRGVSLLGPRPYHRKHAAGDIEEQQAIDEIDGGARHLPNRVIAPQKLRYAITHRELIGINFESLENLVLRVSKSAGDLFADAVGREFMKLCKPQLLRREPDVPE